MCLWHYNLPFSVLFCGFYFFNFGYFVLERGEGRENERERNINQCVALSCITPTGDLAHNPGICPGWEWNWRPFGSQASAQSTEPHQPGLFCGFLPLSSPLPLLCLSHYHCLNWALQLCNLHSCFKTWSAQVSSPPGSLSEDSSDCYVILGLFFSFHQTKSVKAKVLLPLVTSMHLLSNR